MKSTTKVRLARYGVLALAGLSCEAAKASVVTSSSQGFVPVTIGAGQSSSIDFGSGIGSPFTFVGSTGFFSAPFASFVIHPGASGVSKQILAVGNDPLRLAGNYVISAGKPWVTPLNNTSNDIAGADGGNWDGTGTVTGYLGFRFESTALTMGEHYGYFSVSYDNSPTSDSGHLTINGWAYETSSGASITTPGASASVAPEPSSLALAGLGLLSCGAAGLRTLRERKRSSEA